jgi:hypothetical protein
VNAALWRCSRTTGTGRTRRKENRPRRPPPAVHDSGNHVSEDHKKNYSLLQYRTPSHSIVNPSVDEADVEARRKVMMDAGMCTGSRNGGVHTASVAGQRTARTATRFCYDMVQAPLVCSAGAYGRDDVQVCVALR